MSFINRQLSRALGSLKDNSEPPRPDDWPGEGAGEAETIDRQSAVAEIGRSRFSGFLAWLLWLFIHIMYLNGFDTKLRFFLEWAWSYIFWRKGARQITGDDRREVG